MRHISNEELKQILENHEKWLNGEGGERADLSGINLEGADLRYKNLRCAILRGTHLMFADLRNADLRYADLFRANLFRADLRGADLSKADLDYSCLPLWCGSLSAHFDDRQLKQIAYHLVKAGLQSKNASEATKKELSKLIDFANEFHRVEECGMIEKADEACETANIESLLAGTFKEFKNFQKDNEERKMIEIKAKDLKQGEEFNYSGREFIALGWEQEGILAVAKEPIKNIPFDKNGSNDWRSSSLRKYLNGNFIEKELDPSGLLEFTSDLTADDGLTDYGKSVDLVFLLSADLYRKYRYFMPKWNTWVWLITPWSCLPSYGSLVRFVYTDGSLNYYNTLYGFGAAVACLFNPDTSVSCTERKL